MKELQDLLQAGINFAPYYLPSYNSDHLPMTLCAMTGLGAAPDQLHAFRDSYRTRLHGLDPPAPLSNWRDGIGDIQAYPALLGYFQEEITTQEVAATAQHYLPEFLPGLALGAFHPILRLGYSFDFHCNDETAVSLAYMAAIHKPFPAATGLLIDLETVLDDQVQRGKRGMQRKFQSLGFSGSIWELVRDGDYPQDGCQNLENCADVALKLYRSTRDFFALHLVTATQAVRVVTNSLTDEPTRVKAVTSMARAILASHLVLGSPAFDATDLPPAALDPEHAFKYVWACLSEYRHYGTAVYLDEIHAFKEAGLVPDWAAQEVV